MSSDEQGMDEMNSDMMDDGDEKMGLYDDSNLLVGFHRLNEDAKILDEKKRKLADDYFRRQCPFKPSITQRENNFQRSENVFTSLYENSKHRKERQEKMAEHLREQQMNELSFTPQVNNPSRKVNGSEATDRLYHSALRKMEDDFQKTLNIKNIDEECSFQPSLNLKSQKLVKNKTGVVERLAPSAEQMASRKYQLQKIKESLTSDGCTFAPKINQKSKQMSGIPNGGDTFNRLYEESKYKAKKNAQLKRNYDRGIQEQMVMVLPTRSGKLKPDKQVFERLYERSKRYGRSMTPPIKPTINKDGRPLTSDVTFKPTLLSKKGKSHGTDVLYQKGVEQIKNRNRPDNNKGRHASDDE